MKLGRNLVVSVVLAVIAVLMVALVVDRKDSPGKNDASNDAIATRDELDTSAFSQGQDQTASTAPEEAPGTAASTVPPAEGQSDDPLAGSENLEALIKPGFYAEPWKRKLADYEGLMDVTITDIPEPGQYTLQLKPIPDRRYRYVAVTTASFASQKAPFMRMAHDTQLATELNDKGELLINIQQERPWALQSGKEMPESPKLGEACQFMVREGDLYKMRSDGSGPEDTSTSLASGDIQNHVFNFPQGQDIRLGSSWAEERQGPVLSKATYTVSGFAEVGGVKTARIASEKAILVNASVSGKIMDVAFKAMVAETVNMGGNPANSEAKEQMLRAHAAKSGKQELLEKAVTYVDIETGFVVRREVTVTTGSGPYETTTKEISQSIPY